jgi:hypothetical protein
MSRTVLVIDTSILCVWLSISPRMRGTASNWPRGSVTSSASRWMVRSPMRPFPD